MSIKKILEKTGDMPTLPSVAARINSEMLKESLTARRLGAIISEDAALTAKILRLANSAFYGLSSQVVSVEKAIIILGFNAVKNLALSISIYLFFRKGIKTNIDVQGLWNHCLGCAVAAKILVEKTDKRLGDDAFLFGVIHDIGKIILINNHLTEMEKVLGIMKEQKISQNAAENEVFGFTHQKLGGLLLKEWKFPENIIAGVRLHHDLPPNPKKLDHDAAQTIRALCIGNQMAKALALGKSTDPGRMAIPPQMWKFLGAGKDDLPALSARIKEEYGNILTAWAAK